MILALQFYEGDVYIAKALTRLICDLETNLRTNVTFCAAAARGTNEHAIRDIEQIATPTFKNVIVLRHKRFGDGWPVGPNNLWFETMMRLNKMRGKLKEEWVLTIEADCIMMRRDWLNIMVELCQIAEEKKALAIGHHHGAPKTHINGNGIFHIDIVRERNLDEGDGIGGWDVWNARKLLPVSIDTPMIHQIYRIRQAKRERIAEITKQGQRPALFHGIKGMLGIDAVRWMMATGQLK